ncbi:MAG: adenine-specific methyltransferase EcoRI family protein, partial [Kiritimatiellia bacterium]
MATSTLTRAKKNRADEFYTQMPDIEAELRHYRSQFEGKSVLCNCDDPYESNFFRYFALNFNYLGLRKLVATCYAGSSVMQTELPLFDIPSVAEADAAARLPYKIEISEVVDTNADGAADLVDVAHLLRSRKNVLTILEGDGDFRSPECVELMRQADIVVTNPPFSLFREFMAQLMALDKKFLIIGSKNAITYLDIF